MTELSIEKPEWDRLYEVAAAQEGLFTARQALEAGYSPQLLHHYLRIGRITRERRGIYRLVHFPAGECEPLVIAWLWSEHQGVFSHLTALSLHRLSDVLPARIHLSLPPEWRRRRYRIPDRFTLYYADVAAEDRTWYHVVPVTTVRRTLEDCVRDHVSPDLLLQAVQQALHRGLVDRKEISAVVQALQPYGRVTG